MRRLRAVPLAILSVLLGCGRIGFDDAESLLAQSTGGDLGMGSKPEQPSVGGSSGIGGTSLGGVIGSGGLLMNCTQDCPETVLVEADFETEHGGTIEFVDASSPGQLELVASPVHSGDTAVRVQQGTSGDGTGLRFSFDPVTSDTLYFRGWVYLPYQNLNSGINVFELVTQTSEWIDVNIEVNRRLEGYFPLTLVGLESANGVVPFDDWFCLQVETVVSDTEGSVTVSINGGPPLLALTGQDTLPEGGISAMAIGLPFTYPYELGSEIYFDDLTLSTMPVGCQ